jgi:pimeloyl-ACP methyl ester carboxylesterase
MQTEQNDTFLQMVIRHIEIDQTNSGRFFPVSIKTTRGDIDCHYYTVEGATQGAIWVGGAGGGFDSPAYGLYERLSERLQDAGIASLRVRYRYPNHLAECVLDVLTGLYFLDEEEIVQTALTGHSFGGAVVVQAAAAAQSVRTVVALSTQTYGIDPIGDFPESCSILLAHGKNDHVLPYACSEYAYQLAHEPKRLVLLDNTDHGLDETAPQVEELVYEWIKQELSASE